MKDYTEQLKSYWKSKDFSFIATFKRINKNAGFFNHFTNPVSKMKLYYPEFDGLEVLDKRVSFYYGNNCELTDGAFYKVELDHSYSREGKNNPYSLKIKSVSELNQNKIETFLTKENKQVESKLKYFGGYHKSSDSFASFDNVMLASNGKILMDQGESQKVFVSSGIDLTEGAYYSFSINENKGKLPNAIQTSIEELKTNPYQDHIRLRFERLNNPEANKMIAKLMREIGKGMYDSKQRMIFELLQNADDAPGKEKVGFHIDISGDYFFIMHDGAPFNKDDVEAITSAAESTKRGDSKKTGYKGIGFKSVFTDSSEVWLSSGGYQFAFLRNSSLFEDFDKFYFSSKRYQDYPEFVEEDIQKFKNQRLSFSGSNDIPWQVIPIWQEKLPNEFNDTNFNAYPNPVQFALNIGRNNIEEYKSAIEDIVKRPQFLLFLRNTSQFNSPKNGVLVLRNDFNGVVEIIKLRGEEKQTLNYIKKTFTDIPVSNHAFELLDIGLKKQSKTNDFDVETFYFSDLEGREKEEIPPKLAAAEETEISFGISLRNNKIFAEKEYLEEVQKYSSLFTYLPMEDTRFKLPFLVNADFVPSSNREKIQGDNLWNKYIMINVAEKHVEMLAYFALEYANVKNASNSYLSLLLKNPLPEDDTAQQIIDSYNHHYLEQLEVQDIVVNDNNETQLLSETILDDSGLIELFGHDIFYKIIDTDKHLPHSNLDISYLKNYSYLDVEVIDLEELAKKITPEICESLGVIIAKNYLYEKPELLKWLNKLVSHIPYDFGRIPFIVHNNALFSLERLVAEEDAWLINENTSDYQELIKELGYHTINLNLDKYTNIKGYLHDFGGYIKDKTLAYQRIAVNTKLSKLPTTSKLKLIDFLKNSDFMEGIGPGSYFGKLELFVNENRIARPLQQLISRQEAIEVVSIHQFRIAENEFRSLTEVLQKELIAKDDVFTSFVLNTDLFNEWSLKFNSENISTYVNDLKSIYSWVENTDEISSADWASIPWLYINDETRYTTTDKVYWSNAFYKLSSENYESIKSILHSAEIKTLPLQVCGDLVQTFNLKTDNSSGIIWTEINNLEVLSANTLLDWMENDGAFSDFFEEYTLKNTEDGHYVIEEIEEAQIFDGSNKELTVYIQSNEELSSLFNELDKNLCSEDRNKIGLLQSDKLLKAIIDSGAYDQKLAVHLPTKISLELLQKFINNLAEFNLKTSVEYDSNSSEHIVINHLLRSVENINDIPIEVQRTLETLRAKIIINQNPLSNYNISDRVSFGIKEDRKVLSLSDILGEFQGDSDELESVKESFISITQQEKLRKLIFKTIPLRPEEIHSKIEEEASDYYSVNQVVFQLLDKTHGGRRNWSKPRFNAYHLNQGDENQLKKSYQSLLDILIGLPLTDLSDFKFHDLTLSNCVDKNFAIESEVIPEWLEEWINKDQTKRLAFISMLGYNGIGSAIINFRKSLIAKDYDQNSSIRYFEESKPNMRVIWNTIVWLSDYNPHIITRNIAVIKQVNNYIKFQSDSIKIITIPVIKAIDAEGKRNYYLQAVSTESELLKLNSQNEFANSVVSILNSRTNNPIFIDESIGKLSEHLNISVVELEESIDIDCLLKESTIWDEPFYQKWEHYNKYPIYLYNGEEIPYLRAYKGITINEFTNDLKVSNDGRFYITKRLKNDILNNLPSNFPSSILSNLRDWHYKTLQNDSLLDEDSFDYKEDIDRLLQDRLGISEEDQKQESGNAKTHAIYYLDKNGYNVSNVNNAGAALTNIISPDDNQVNCIVRSAKGGLLYLDKEHWDMLEDDQTYLIVIYPGNTPRLFKSRLELLDEELAENVLFRVPNNKFTTEIDGVFNALESESHLILVTSEKMKESLFSKLKQKREFNKQENVAVGEDGFKL